MIIDFDKNKIQRPILSTSITTARGRSLNPMLNTSIKSNFPPKINDSIPILNLDHRFRRNKIHFLWQKHYEPLYLKRRRLPALLALSGSNFSFEIDGVVVL